MVVLPLAVGGFGRGFSFGLSGFCELGILFRLGIFFESRPELYCAVDFPARLTTSVILSGRTIQRFAAVKGFFKMQQLSVSQQVA